MNIPFFHLFHSLKDNPLTTLCQYPIVRITTCLGIIIATTSLFTPYPAQLIRAIQGNHESNETTSSKESAKQARPSTTKPSKPPTSSRPTPVAPPQHPIEPDIATNMVDADLVKPWSLDRTASAPSVHYPPFPPVISARPSTGAFWNVQDLSRGLNLKTQVKFTEGSLASTDRRSPSNYRATLTYEIALPKPLTQVSQLQRLNPHLTSMLPGLSELFSSAKVSPFYHQIYARKQTEVRKKMAQLNKVLDRHNFYDTETILEMTHPQSGRKVLWLQSEMDVVSDGSDGDRLAVMPQKILKSSFYQPSTSYRWKKQTDKPNPLLAPWENRLKNARAELLKAPASTREALRDDIDYARRVIAELKTYSFLIAEYDPFIVIPLGVVKQNSPYSPAFGDYAIVIVGKQLYPAIVGDAGPRYKTGEASLRLASTINGKANSYARPVSDLKASYLIFPGTAPTVSGPPDYKKWQEQCQSLLNDIGGISPNYALYEWEDLLAPKPVIPPPTNTLEPPTTSPSGDAKRTIKPLASPTSPLGDQSSSLPPSLEKRPPSNPAQ
ncbi:MAG: glycoside hydrolase family 75 protein [Akkermansia sp.]